jgi:hypothetical protein
MVEGTARFFTQLRAGVRAEAWIAVVVLIAVTVVAAWSRVGLFDLPFAPSSITAYVAGIHDPTYQRRIDSVLHGGDFFDGPVGYLEEAPSAEPGGNIGNAMRKVREGILAAEKDGNENALEQVRAGARMAPDSLPLSNAYRMVVFRMRRDYLIEARKRGDLTPKFPPHLDRQPIAFFEELVREHPSRETKLQLALSWVDEMLLFPALEIKAPSSVEAVKILTDIIDNGNEYYVPALFARGLNHLHRPARLVWPEADKTPPDAAARDIGLCVAIGRKVGGSSPRLQATLAMTLGDAYVKAGRLSVARSWWQIAQNLCHDDDIEQAVRRRYGWRDEEILDRLEEELDRARTELDHPMTDLALMWN